MQEAPLILPHFPMACNSHGRKQKHSEHWISRRVEAAKSGIRSFPPWPSDLAPRREARRSDWRARQGAVKREATQARLAQAQAEEDAKMERFRALVAHGPLQIQKRQ
jgi:hypothetical protein